MNEFGEINCNVTDWGVRSLPKWLAEGLGNGTWLDRGWKNDQCPRFTKEGESYTVEVWVDNYDSNLRDEPRFHVTLKGNDVPEDAELLYVGDCSDLALQYVESADRKIRSRRFEKTTSRVWELLGELQSLEVDLRALGVEGCTCPRCGLKIPGGKAEGPAPEPVVYVDLDPVGCEELEDQLNFLPGVTVRRQPGCCYACENIPEEYQELTKSIVEQFYREVREHQQRGDDPF